MKRGLKVPIRLHLVSGNSVATIAPMKRGLKDALQVGTVKDLKVATIAPMKRGLKVVENGVKIETV